MENGFIESGFQKIGYLLTCQKMFIAFIMKKTRKIVMSKKHPKDKPDIYIAFAICYHKYMGWDEPKERIHLIEKQATQLKIGEKFYIAGAGGISRKELRCCGYMENGAVLYEFFNGKKTIVWHLKPTFSVFIKKEK